MAGGEGQEKTTSEAGTKANTNDEIKKDQTKKVVDVAKAAADAVKTQEKNEKTNAKEESKSEHASAPTLKNSAETVNTVPTTATNPSGPKVFPGPITTVPKDGKIKDGIKAP